MTSSPSPSRAPIDATQLALLRVLIDQVSQTNRFYQPKLAAAGVDAHIESLAAFTNRLPFTTKTQLIEDQQAHPPYGTNLTFPLESYTRFHQTSGTTRAPLRWLDTPESWNALLDAWRKVYEAANVHAGDRIYFAFSFGPFIGFWMAFDAAANLGCLCLPGGGLSSAARLAAILDNHVTVICCTPTYAMRLAEVAALENIDLARSRVRTIIVAGEPGGSLPAIRKRIESAWPGARVFDHHGMTEVGPVTYEHPATPGTPNTLAVIESSYYAEIINRDTLEPVAEGEVGELVLTTLRRTASPLLRYRTGDLVRPRISPDDGQLLLEGGVLGRVDDMVVLRGANIFPGTVEQIIRAVPGVAEYRAEHTVNGAMHELRIQVEPDADIDDPAVMAKRIENDLRIALSVRVPVEVVPPGSLPRFEMKARRWVRRET